MKLFLVVAHDQIEVHGRHTIAKDARRERGKREIFVCVAVKTQKLYTQFQSFVFFTNYDRMSTMCVHVKIVRD